MEIRKRDAHESRGLVHENCYSAAVDFVVVVVVVVAAPEEEAVKKKKKILSFW